MHLPARSASEQSLTGQANAQSFPEEILLDLVQMLDQQASRCLRIPISQRIDQFAMLLLILRTPWSVQ